MTTATEVISYEEILSDLKAIVEEFGADYVYQKPSSDHSGAACKYAHGDKPGCIVGQLLTRRGVTVERLAEYDDNSETAIDSLIRNRKLPFAVDARAAELLNNVQVSQDRKHPWGAALEAAAHGETLPYQGL